MAVSSVEGDANVDGVKNWDNDDDGFNDMNVAMTGDMVIRIAQGTRCCSVVNCWTHYQVDD